MSFIKARKKMLSSAAIASSVALLAGHTLANDQVVQLETLHSEANKEQRFKVDQSANKKYVAPLLDTPKSVAVISQQLIQDTQVSTLADALRTVPGITLGAGEGGNPNGDRPFIRGYSSEGSMYVDGIRSGSSQNREMFAIEQVEVTKGSSSTMGGGGNASGNINLISKLAKKGDALQASIQHGSNDYQRMSLDINQELNDDIAGRVVLMAHQNHKAGQGDAGAEYQRVGIAPSIHFGLDSDSRATISYYYLKSDDIPDSGVPYNNPRNYTTGSGQPIDVKQGIYYGWKDRDFQKQDNHIATLRLEHDFNDHLSISNTATYSKSKNDYVWTQPDDSAGNFIDATTGQLKETGVWRRANTRTTDIDNFSNQLALSSQFNTAGLEHRLNTGAEYSHLEGKKGTYLVTDAQTSPINNTACTNGIAASNGWCSSTFHPISNTPFLGAIIANKGVTGTKTTTTGLYIFDNIVINPQWLLDLGVRWDQFETELTTYKTGSTPLAIPTKVDSSSTYWTWNAGLSFKPSSNAAIYASYATSATPVGIDSSESSETAPSNAIKDLDPEQARTFELGTKWDLLEQKLNLSAAIFRTEKTNTRVLIDPTTTINAGESKVDGMELGLNGQLTEKWSIAAGYSYLDSKLVKAAYNAKANEGLPLPNVPKYAATLWSSYQVLAQLSLGAGVTYMDKVYGVKTSSSEKWVPDYTRFDAMARYQVNKNIDLQLNINNLSDERYFSKAYGSHYATEAEGRNAVFAINVKY